MSDKKRGSKLPAIISKEQMVKKKLRAAVDNLSGHIQDIASGSKPKLEDRGTLYSKPQR